jgi:ABC-type transporter Mla maintaining outer membrane lipid asymmetry ATPase subunit MlaF
VVVTHDMSLVEQVADRVALINEGLIYATGTFAELKREGSGFAREFISGEAETEALSFDTNVAEI